MTDVYLSLGSNIQPRLKNLHSAINSINEIPETFVREISSIYRTEPFASKSQPFYFNSAVLLQTKLSPGPLLDQFGMIEESHGRPSIREKNKSRTLDIDIIFFGNTILNTKNLKLPHPFYSQRRFVLIPLSEISPELICPDTKKSITETLACCNDNSDVEIICRPLQ
tara:strand:- start:3960 stop:4460 length:501 start_codon:yes stop_codon:yes gene_type:complete